MKVYKKEEEQRLVEEDEQKKEWPLEEETHEKES